MLSPLYPSLSLTERRLIVKTVENQHQAHQFLDNARGVPVLKKKSGSQRVLPGQGRKANDDKV